MERNGILEKEQIEMVKPPREGIVKECKYNYSPAALAVLTSSTVFLFAIAIFDPRIYSVIIFVFAAAVLAMYWWRYIQGRKNDSRIILTENGIYYPHFFPSGEYKYEEFKDITKLKFVSVYGRISNIKMAVKEFPGLFLLDIEMDMIRSEEDRRELMEFFPTKIAKVEYSDRSSLFRR